MRSMDISAMIGSGWAPYMVQKTSVLPRSLRLVGRFRCPCWATTWHDLNAATAELKTAMLQREDLKDVTDNNQKGLKELEISPCLGLSSSGSRAPP